MTKAQIIKRLEELQELGVVFVMSREYRELMAKLKG
jgi:hypothetical protein